jgi:hypothetical protein
MRKALMGRTILTCWPAVNMTSVPWVRVASVGRMLAPVSIFVLIPVIILGSLLLLIGTFAVLGRFRGGKYMRPIAMGLAKVPLIGRGLKKASMAKLERDNPELARAVQKIEAFGTPKTPEQAQRMLSLLTPAERRVYLDAVGAETPMPEPTNRQQRRLVEKGVKPGVQQTPKPVNRKRSR